MVHSPDNPGDPEVGSPGRCSSISRFWQERSPGNADTWGEEEVQGVEVQAEVDEM